jgi:amino acid adenylation domain-containing protein
MNAKMPANCLAAYPETALNPTSVISPILSFTRSKPDGMAKPVVPQEWNGEEISFPRDLSVVDFFRTQVQARPEACAVKEGDRLMTYAELDLHSNRIANELRQHGLRLEDPVAILRGVSCEFIAAILGVLKAGGTYLPVALDTPKLRLQFLLEDSGSRFVLTDAAGVERLGAWSGLALELARITAASSEEADKDPGVSSDPKRRAYVTYTSGSTGQPKGVEIEHHSWTNLVWHYHQQLGISAQDRSSMLAYPPFDASVIDIWPTLCAGGCLVVPPPGILLNPDGLIAWLASEEITLTFVPTGVAEILFARSWPKQMKLRWFTTGGDRLRVRPPAGLPFSVLNCYGPTENTVVSTFSVVATRDGQKQLPPIGRPLGNVKAYVLDKELHAVPVGVSGELYLGGEQVARGYLGRPELNAARFLPDPFVDKPGRRMYRTGDWVRWLPNGELDFLGRRDDQMQIRGVRVELGEIDAALCSYGGVRQACCIALLDDGMPAGISAHIVPTNYHAGLLDGLRSYLRDRLPSKAMPSEYVLHDRLPLTPQGKLDRKALRSYQPNGARTIRIEDGIEKSLMQLWCSMLPNTNIAEADATFQALGGDSLSAIKLMLGVEEITGQRIELSTFLLRPTFAGLCQEVRRRKSNNKFEPIIELRHEGTRTPLFCLYGLGGDINFHSDFVDALGRDQPVWGVRSPALANLDRLPVSIEDAAEEVRHWIRGIQPEGVPALLGYSWGGLLAFEVSRQLHQAEGISCFTALIGSDAPTRPLTLASRSMRFASGLPRWLCGLMADRRNRGRRFSHWRDMLRNAKLAFSDASAPLPPSMPMAEWASAPIPRHLLNLARKYRPRTVGPVRIDYFRERDAFAKETILPGHPLRSNDQVRLPNGGWDRWTKIPPQVHWVEGDHETVLKPPLLAGLAKAVRMAMDHHFHVTGQFQMLSR